MKIYIAIALGVLLFALGVWLSVMNHVDTSWTRVQATVIGSKVGNGTTKPIVEYTANGTKFQVISSHQPVLGSFQPGDKLTIAYNPNSQGEAKIPASKMLSFVTWALLILGALLVVGGYIVRNRSQHEDDDDTEPLQSSNSPDTDQHQV